MDKYFTIEQQGEASLKEKGSEFIAYAFPVQSIEDVKKALNQLKQTHSKAVHFCYAYRLGFDGKTIKCSDDGEPAGSAGKPIQNQLLSKNLTNIAVVVVRYFGGTLLGVPGLINAYKNATAMVLQVVPLVEKYIEQKYTIECSYEQLNEVLRIVRLYQGKMLHQEQHLFVLLSIAIPKNRVEEFKNQIQLMYSVNVQEIV